MYRTTRAGLALSLVLVLGGALTGCPTTSTPPVSWVVAGSGAHGDKSPGGHLTHYVECVPDGDLAKPRTEQDVWRHVEVPAEVAYRAEDGQPCPAGKILEDVR